MHRNEGGTPRPKLLPSVLLALILGLFTAVAPAAADEAAACDGEPTDPEGALVLVHEYEVDLSEHGLTEEVRTEDADSWLAAVVDLLRTLGILPPEGTGS